MSEGSRFILSFNGEGCAGAVGCEFGSVLALKGCHAAGERAGDCGCHVVGDVVSSFGEVAYEEARRGVEVLAIECEGTVPDEAGQLVDGCEGRTALVIDADVLEVAVGLDGELHAYAFAQCEAACLYPGAVALY